MLFVKKLDLKIRMFIQSAAELRSRHRAWEFAIWSNSDWVAGSLVMYMYMYMYMYTYIYIYIYSRVERWLCHWQLKLYEHLPLSSRKISAYDCLCLSLRKSLFWMMYFENFSPGTSFEAGRTPRARRPGRWRVFQKAFGRLQEALWRFQRGLGRLQEVLEGFWRGFRRSGRCPMGGGVARGGFQVP